MPEPLTFFADMVREASRSVGTTAVTLDGPLPGHRSFASVVPQGRRICYTIAGITHAGEWESGTGEIDASGRLVRSAVSASSAGGGLVDFSVGLKSVALTVGAAWFNAVDAVPPPPPPPNIAEIPGLQSALDAKFATAGFGGFGLTLAQAADAVAARTLLSVGSMGLQSANAIAISGGTISNVTISATTLSVTAPLLLPSGGPAAPSLAVSGDTNTGVYFPAADTIAFTTGGIERLRVGSAGGIHIGGTSPLASYPLRVLGQVLIENSNSGVLTMQAGTGGANPKSLSLQIMTDGRTFFDPPSGGSFEIRPGGSSACHISAAAIRPGGDNVASCGTAGQRFTTVYAATGTINTSDERDKSWRGAMSRAERAAAMDIVGELGFFQWNDAKADKGADARLHFGVRAQQVWRIMAAHGLIDPIGADGRPGKTPYAFLCFDAWPDDAESCQRAGQRFGVRHDQLSLFLLAAALGGSRRPARQ